LGSPELNGAIAVDIFIYFWIFFFLKPRIAFESSFERKKEKERKREREKERKREREKERETMHPRFLSREVSDSIPVMKRWKTESFPSLMASN